MPASIDKIDGSIVSLSPAKVICDAGHFTPAACAAMLPVRIYPRVKGTKMTTPSFDSVEAQASYGIGLQV
ncbi:MAG: hypothetical protein ABN485_20770, partial [Pantoea agglomerans]